MPEQQVADVGVLISETPTIEIAGTDYPIRPLGIMDAMQLSRILAKAMGVIGRIAALEQVKEAKAKIDAGEAPIDVIGTYIFDLIPIVGEELVDWLATTLMIEAEGRRLTPEEWKEDTFRFPLGSELAVINQLVQGPEIETFFDGVRTLMGNPALKSWGAKMGTKLASQLSSAASSESKPDTDGA